MASLRSGISSQTHLKSESRRYNEDHDTRDASSSTSLNTVRFPIQRGNILITESQRDREGRHRLEGTLSSLRRGCEHAGSAWLPAPTAMAGGPRAFARHRAKETRQLESSMETKTRGELCLKS